MDAAVASTNHDRFLAVRYFRSLDGLRAFAVLAVVWHHTAGSGRPGLAGRGALGVEFFFAISGFLITTLLLRERDRYGRISLRDFYIRRTLRIFPLYYATLLLYVALTLGTGRRDTAAGRSFIAHLPAFLTYTSNWFVDLNAGERVTFYFAWSLATEEQFYIVWPPVLVAVFFLAKGRLWAPLVVLIGLIVVDGWATVADAGNHSLATTIISSVATPICAGAALAMLLHSQRGYALLESVVARRWSPLAAFAVVLALVVGDASPFLIGPAMALTVVACCAREDHYLAGFLAAAPLRFVGVLSYGVYLLHMLAVNLVRPVLAAEKGPHVFLATVPLVLGMAWLSYRYFETPILRYKRRFERVGHNDPELSMATGEPVEAGGTHGSENSE